jgi:tetratricopeptide (TPR) repeat protein
MQRFGETENAYKEALAFERDLAPQNPAVHRPVLALMLTQLGLLYEAMQRHGEAESAQKEALAIQRDLAAQNPAPTDPTWP